MAVVRPSYFSFIWRAGGSRSRQATSTPASPSTAASVRPDSPPPTIRTSVLRCFFMVMVYAESAGKSSAQKENPGPPLPRAAPDDVPNPLGDFLDFYLFGRQQRLGLFR